MIVGACVLPSAPLLVPGVSPDPPPGVATIADAIDVAVEGLPDSHAMVLLAPGPATAVHADARIDLAGIGRGDIVDERPTQARVVRAVADALGLEPAGGGPMPLGLAVLGLLLGSGPPMVPVTVADDVDFHDGAAVGAAIAGVAGGAGAPELVLVAAGDLSAGHGPASPRPHVEGAAEYDQRVVDALDRGRLEELAQLGPDEAGRVHAVGWPSLVALHGALGTAEVGLVRRRYGAPCGVGYLVAHGG